MAIYVEKHWFEGGSGIPRMGEVVKAIHDDLAGVTCATITTVNASDLPTAIALVNDIKVKLNATSAYTKELNLKSF